MSRSKTKSEYRAIALACAELIWLRSLLVDLLISLKTTSVLINDNAGAKAFAHNLVFHARTKHIKVDRHFIHDQVVAALLRLNCRLLDQSTSYCLVFVSQTQVNGFPQTISLREGSRVYRGVAHAG